ncbi:MAG: hypothetical protein Q9181_006123 [Wetmoreana brouardii]
MASVQQTTWDPGRDRLWLPRLDLISSQTNSSPDSRSPERSQSSSITLQQLAEYIAGRLVPELLYDKTRSKLTPGVRWAAKEATVKAHRYRKLYVHDISIVLPVIPPRVPKSKRSYKVHALVAPRNTKNIVMDPQVAEKRGLSATPPFGPTIYGNMANGQFVRAPHDVRREEIANHSQHPFRLRKAKLETDQPQVAEISISHEKKYAVAMCVALDEQLDGPSDIEYVLDDGTGEPLHEPLWGDEGWLVEDENAADFDAC